MNSQRVIGARFCLILALGGLWPQGAGADTSELPREGCVELLTRNESRERARGPGAVIASWIDSQNPNSPRQKALSNDEFVDLIRRIQTGSRNERSAAIVEIFRYYSAFANRLARKLGGAGYVALRDDLRQQALVGLMRAAEKFDLEKGNVDQFLSSMLFG